jgi:Ser/Thr protein kinase RdoA (MazF antagonist)
VICYLLFAIRYLPIREAMSIPPLRIPAGLAAAYGVSQVDLRFITQVQNYIFAYERNGEEFILRLTPQTHQSPEQVRAEVDWVNDLAGRGVPVAGVVPASDGSLCQAVELVGEHFTAVSFQKVKGEIGSGNYWTADIFFEWGRLTGRLHRESRKYQPALGRRRASWGDQLPSVIPESVDDEIAMERLAKVAEGVHSLPKSSDSYGLIHADLHFWNFGVSPAGLTVFDFGNSEYNWFVADLGTAVFEAATCGYQKLPRDEFIKGFLEKFVEGYERESTLGAAVEQIPLFAKVREICIYLVLRRRWKNRPLSEFQRRFFESVRVGVVEDRPFVASRIASSLRE